MSKGTSEDRAQAASKLLLAGFLLYLVSWFAPAVQALGTPGLPHAGWPQFLSNMPPQVVEATMSGPEWLPGWIACKVSFLMLRSEGAPQDTMSGRRRLAGSSCLSNLGMLAALLLLGSRTAPRIVGVVLILCTGLNASWLYLANTNPFAFLRAGYFFWLLSFPLVGLGLILRPQTPNG